MNRPSERLKTLRLALPAVVRPVGAYVPALRHNSLVLTSGQIPMRDGKLVYSGKVGGTDGVSLEDAQAAARLCTLNAVAAAAEAVGGVDRLLRVIKLVVYVASSAGFVEQHKVANGASELLSEIFGEAGHHARAAVGVAELPLNASVEVDVTFGLS